ncbi:MAG: HD domain-containing protein [Nitrospira sp.]|nr:HD domain-containing protein [Nitrospira sp.]
MEQESVAIEKTIITDIKKRIRLLQTTILFIIFTLLAVILRYLYKPANELLDFLPDISITIIIVICLGLAGLGFYILRTVSRQTVQKIEEYSSRLASILNITRDLREEIYGDILLDKVIDYSIAMTHSDAGSILLFEDNNLVFKIAKGEKVSELIGKVIPKGKGISGWVAENSTPLRIANARDDKRFNPELDGLTGYHTGSVLCVPLILKTVVIGVIELLNKKNGFYTKQDEEIISYLADQAAISIASAKFYDDQKNYEIHITNMLLEAIDFNLLGKLEHSKRVANYCNIIAREINMSEQARKRLYFASLLHDVGFLKIRTEDRSTPSVFKKHPITGYEMIQPITFYADIAPFILYHHERYDGTGYPAGIEGEAIPLGARILAIAEAFDAMVSESTYKKPLTFDGAILELQRNAGTQFDPWLIEVFVKNITPEILK